MLRMLPQAEILGSGQRQHPNWANPIAVVTVERFTFIRRIGRLGG